MIKRMEATISLILAIVFLWGCGDVAYTGKDSESIVTTPTELTFVFASGDEHGRAAMLNVVNKFNEEYEDINVTVKIDNSGAYDDVLKTLDSVGEFPDILESTNIWDYATSGLLSPLPDDIVQLFKDTIVINGEVYAAPYTLNNTFGILYNKSYFEEKNLCEPETYEEFLSLCEQIEQLSDMSPLVVAGADIWHMGFWFEKAYEDQVVSQDEDFIIHCYDGTTDFSCEEFRQTLLEVKNIMNFAQNGWENTTDTQVADYLVNGKAAMLYSGTHMFSTLNDIDSNFEVGWFPIPSPDGKLRLVGGSSANGLAISSGAASDPNKKAAAEEFIRFFFKAENYIEYCKALGNVPITIEASEIEIVETPQETLDALKEADWVGTMWNNELGKKALPSGFRNSVYRILIEYLLDEINLNTACDEINEEWRQGTVFAIE